MLYKLYKINYSITVGKVILVVVALAVITVVVVSCVSLTVVIK